MKACYKVWFFYFVLLVAEGLNAEAYQDIINEIKIIEKANEFLLHCKSSLNYENSLEAAKLAIVDGHDQLVLWDRELKKSKLAPQEDRNSYNRAVHLYRKAVKKFYLIRVNHYETERKKQVNHPQSEIPKNPIVLDPSTHLVAQNFDIEDVVRERNIEIDAYHFGTSFGARRSH